jgi:hypothetical protein
MSTAVTATPATTWASPTSASSDGNCDNNALCETDVDCCDGFVCDAGDCEPPVGVNMLTFTWFGAGRLRPAEQRRRGRGPVHGRSLVGHALHHGPGRRERLELQCGGPRGRLALLQHPPRGSALDPVRSVLRVRPVRLVLRGQRLELRFGRRGQRRGRSVHAGGQRDRPVLLLPERVHRVGSRRVLNLTRESL